MLKTVPQEHGFLVLSLIHKGESRAMLLSLPFLFAAHSTLCHLQLSARSFLYCSSLLPAASSAETGRNELNN